MELRELRTKEVPPLKKTHWQLEDLGLANGKRELLAAFGRRTSSVDFLLVGFAGYFPFDHNPGSTLGTSYARTNNVISHAPSV